MQHPNLDGFINFAEGGTHRRLHRGFRIIAWFLAVAITRRETALHQRAQC